MQLYLDNREQIDKIITTIAGSHHNQVEMISCRIMFDRQDIESYLKEQVIKGLKLFDSKKSKLSTFVFTICIRNIRSYYTRWTNHRYSGYFPKDKVSRYDFKPTVNIESFIDPDKDISDISDHFEYLSTDDADYVKDIPEEIFRICRKQVTDKKKDILKIYELYYLCNLGINTISKITGIKLKTVDNIITKANFCLRNNPAAKSLVR